MTDATRERGSERSAVVRKFSRFVVVECLRFLGLVLLVTLVSCVMAKMVAATTVVEFFDGIHLDRDGRSIWEPFLYACKVSLPVIGLSVVLLTVGALIVAAISGTPGMGWVKIVTLAVSAMPSLLLPFLYYLFQPWVPFKGFPNGGVLIPAVCLAIGDCNLSTVASQFRESLRAHRVQTHLRTVQSLGRQPWMEIWPRACVTLISSISGRIPHLIGGLVALELLFNINGIGIVVFDAFAATPANLHWFLWIGILCVTLRSIFRWIELAARWFLMPETFREDPVDAISDQDHSSESVLADDPLIDLAARSAASDNRSLRETVEQWLPASDANQRAPRFYTVIRRNIAYYIGVSPLHGLNVLLAIAIVLSFVLVLVGCLGYGDAAYGGSFEGRSGEHWFGTDQGGIDLVSSVRTGFFQQIVPGMAALLTGMIAIPAAAFALFRWLKRGRLQRLAAFTDKSMLYLGEFIESLPKLLVLLAAYSALPGGTVKFDLFGIPFSFNSMVVRLFALIGLLHAPQVYRAVRDELAVLNHSVYIEATMLTRLRWKKMFFGIILRNHCLHIILIQTAVIAAGVLHYDTVLSMMGVRGPGVIFTWGSTLGIAAEAYMQYAYFSWFNDWVLVVPLLVVWLGILSFWIIGESIKILWGGYVYRLR